MSRLFRFSWVLMALLSLFTPPSFANRSPDDLNLQGELTQGGMVLGKVAPGTGVMLNGKAVAVAKTGDYVIGFGRDEDLSQTLALTLPSGEVRTYPLALSKRDYDIQRIEGIPKKIMSPSKENLKRIREETRQVNEARGALVERLDFLPGFDWPLKGPITGVYGSQRFYNGEPNRPHFGLDIAAPVGTPVVAPADGVVTLAHPDMFYSGGTLIIDHGMGVFSTFIHLNKVLVKKGDKLQRGQKVALVGAKGRSTGPHLDWRLNWFEVRLDPALVMKNKPQ